MPFIATVLFGDCLPSRKSQVEWDQLPSATRGVAWQQNVQTTSPRLSLVIHYFLCSRALQHQVDARQPSMQHEDIWQRCPTTQFWWSSISETHLTVSTEIECWRLSQIRYRVFTGSAGCHIIQRYSASFWRQYNLVRRRCAARRPVGSTFILLDHSADSAVTF